MESLEFDYSQSSVMEAYQSGEEVVVAVAPNQRAKAFMRYNSFEDIEAAEKTLPVTWFLASRAPTPELAPVEEQKLPRLEESKPTPVATPSSSRLSGLPRTSLLDANLGADEILSQTHRRGRRWSAEEDSTLLELVEVYGKDWKELASRFPGKTSKQIKERWSNQLDPRIVDCPWSVEEDFKLVLLVRLHGRSWCRIAKEMNGRTELMLKNRFHSFLRKKLGPEVFEQPTFDEFAIRHRLEKLTRRSSIALDHSAASTHDHSSGKAAISSIQNMSLI
jgi:hypothetical protein